MLPDPHLWLGLDFQELLPGLAAGQHRFSLSLTRPDKRCYGSGRLRVVGVRSGGPSYHCVLAYEHYHRTDRKHQGADGDTPDAR